MAIRSGGGFPLAPLGPGSRRAPLPLLPGVACLCAVKKEAQGHPKGPSLARDYLRMGTAESRG